MARIEGNKQFTEIAGRIISRKLEVAGGVAIAGAAIFAGACGGGDKATPTAVVRSFTPEGTSFDVTTTPTYVSEVYPDKSPFMVVPTATLTPEPQVHLEVSLADEIETLVRQGFANPNAKIDRVTVPVEAYRDVEKIIAMIRDCDAGRVTGVDPADPNYQTDLEGKCLLSGQATAMLAGGNPDVAEFPIALEKVKTLAHKRLTWYTPADWEQVDPLFFRVIPR